MSDFRAPPPGAQDFSDPDGLLRRFWRDLEAHGAAPALIGPGGLRLSHAELAAAADRWRARYAQMPGGGAPALIALEIVPDPEVIAAYLGALRGGHAALLADAATMAPEHPVMALYRPNILVRGRGPGTVAEPGDPERPAMHPDLAVLLSTSGTTGAPKLVRLSRRNIAANAGQIVRYLGLTPAERAIVTLPLHYSYGMSVLHAHLAAGASLVLTEDSVIDPAFWTAFREHRATSLALVPHQFELLAAAGFAEMSLPTLRYVTQAGGRLAAPRVEEFRALGARAGWQLVVMYGQTEAAPRIAWIPPADLAANADTIGRPVPGGRLWVADADGRPVTAPGVAGELVYEGPNVMLGYAESRADLALPAGPERLETGDIAEITDSGFFRIVGRKARFVKLFGLRLSLDQMDRALAEAGHQAFCANVSDRLVVLHRDPAEGRAVAQLLAEACDLPADVILTEPLQEIPLLPSGKTDQRALQRLAEAAVARQPDAAPAADDLRAALARATRRTRIGDGDSFSALGGDSLGYLQMALALEARLGRAPEGWETMPIAMLEAMPRGQAARGSLDSDVLTRLAAVGLIVVRHFNQWPIGGGTWVLLAIVGYSLARFGRGPILAGRPGRLLAQMLYPILPLYYLILLAWFLSGRSFDPGMVLLTANLGPEGPGVLVTPNWFISLYVQLVLISIGTLALPPVRRAIARAPWRAGMAALAATLALSLVYQGWFAPEQGPVRSDWIHLIRVPMTCLPFVVLGWCIFYAEGRVQRAATALAVLAVAITFPAPSPDYTIVIAGLCLCLLSGIRIPMPARLARILRQAAAATLFVYLLHGIPVHLFRHATPIGDWLGPVWGAVAIVPVAFLLAWIVKLAFERVDALVLHLLRRRRGGHLPRAAA